MSENSSKYREFLRREGPFDTSDGELLKEFHRLHRIAQILADAADEQARRASKIRATWKKLLMLLGGIDE